MKNLTKLQENKIISRLNQSSNSSLNDCLKQKDYILKQLAKEGYADNHKYVIWFKEGYQLFDKYANHLIKNVKGIELEFDIEANISYFDVSFSVGFNKYDVKDLYEKEYEEKNSIGYGTDINSFGTSKTADIMNNLFRAKRNVWKESISTGNGNVYQTLVSIYKDGFRHIIDSIK
jgi:hypothetical protein